MVKVLVIVARAIFIHLIHKAIHFRTLLLDGVYVYPDNRPHDLGPARPESRHSQALLWALRF